MPEVTKNLRDGQLTIKDGAAATIVVALDEGDLSFTVDTTPREIKDRGAHDHLRLGDENAIEMSFTCKFTRYQGRGGGDPSVRDGLKQEGNASGWTTTNTDGGDVYTTDLDFLISDPDGTNELLAFAKFAVDTLEFSEGEEYDTLSVSGKAYGGLTPSHTS